jgi:hypothetical protein
MVSYLDPQYTLEYTLLLPLLPLMLPPLLGLAHALHLSPQRLSHEVERPEIVDPSVEMVPSVMFV